MINVSDYDKSLFVFFVFETSQSGMLILPSE